MAATQPDSASALIVIDLQKTLASIPTAPGFSVALAVDAMTDISAQAHASSLDRISARPGEIGTVKVSKRGA